MLPRNFEYLTRVFGGKEKLSFVSPDFKVAADFLARNIGANSSDASPRQLQTHPRTARRGERPEGWPGQGRRERLGRDHMIEVGRASCRERV